MEYQIAEVGLAMLIQGSVFNNLMIFYFILCSVFVFNSWCNDFRNDWQEKFYVEIFDNISTDLSDCLVDDLDNGLWFELW
jgi:hypothetical protein